MKNRYLSLADRTLTACFALSYILVSVCQARASFLLLGELILFTAIRFFLVTLLLHFFAKKRPYQESSNPPPRKGKNDSFPSRHAFSAFLIATISFSVKTLFGYALLPLAVTLSAIRVFRGIHYPIDVIAGGMIGVVFGTLYLIVI